MIAVYTKILHATNTLPKRIKATAGKHYRPIIVSYDRFDDISEAEIHAKVAKEFMTIQKWTGDFVSGYLQTQDIWAHVFLPPQLKLELELLRAK